MRVQSTVIVTLMVTLVGFGGVAWAGLDHEMPSGPGSAELERVKQLVGRWEGTGNHGGKESEPAVVEYKVTSGGSAVVETLGPGTPHEMVSVYHDHGGKLSMTHYCMLRNQPELDLTSATDNELNLSLREGSIDPNLMHMHQLTVTWTDPDHITQVWTGYDAGKPTESMTLTLSRVGGSQASATQ